MAIKITFLGTSSMVPTKKRNHSAIFINLESHCLLFDCGEGTQRQIQLAGFKLTKITKIFISHWHGDHVLGLPGLFLSLGASEYNKKLEIYGPKNTKKNIKLLDSLFNFSKKINYNVIEIIKSGTFYKNSDFTVSSYILDHSAPTLGFVLTESNKRNLLISKIEKLGIKRGPLLGKLQKGKSILHKGKKINPDSVTKVTKGKKITILSDTGVCSNANLAAKGADLLICEATFLDDMKEKAKEYKHLTAKQAASIAKKSKVKKLILTHFSPRYKNSIDILKEAKVKFKNAQCAKDLHTIHIK